MKLTKYEYNHKDDMKTGRHFYSTPLERIIFIVFITIFMFSIPFGLVFINMPYNIAFLIMSITSIIVYSIIIEYNPLMVINFIHYLISSLIFKNDVYKEIVKQIRDYHNVLKYEKNGTFVN